jgi:hypothetical protein
MATRKQIGQTREDINEDDTCRSKVAMSGIATEETRHMITYKSFVHGFETLKRSAVLKGT